MTSGSRWLPPTQNVCAVAAQDEYQARAEVGEQARAAPGRPEDHRGRHGHHRADATGARTSATAPGTDRAGTTLGRLSIRKIVETKSAIANISPTPSPGSSAPEGQNTPVKTTPATTGTQATKGARMVTSTGYGTSVLRDMTALVSRHRGLSGTTPCAVGTVEVPPLRR